MTFNVQKMWFWYTNFHKSPYRGRGGGGTPPPTPWDEKELDTQFTQMCIFGHPILKSWLKPWWEVDKVNTSRNKQRTDGRTICYTTFPSSMTSILSESSTVLSRCAIVSVVQSLNADRIVSWIRLSVSVSIAAVASSKNRIWKEKKSWELKPHPLLEMKRKESTVCTQTKLSLWFDNNHF